MHNTGPSLHTAPSSPLCADTPALLGSPRTAARLPRLHSYEQDIIQPLAQDCGYTIESTRCGLCIVVRRLIMSCPVSRVRRFFEHRAGPVPMMPIAPPAVKRETAQRLESPSLSSFLGPVVACSRPQPCAQKICPHETIYVKNIFF